MCTPSYELSFGEAGHLLDKPLLKEYSPENQRNGPMFVSKAYPLNATSWSFGRLWEARHIIGQKRAILQVNPFLQNIKKTVDKR